MVTIARWVDDDGAPASGFIRDDRAARLPDGLTSNDLLELGLTATLDLAAAMDTSEFILNAAGLRLLPPLVPATIRDFVAFEEHVEGVVKSINQTAGVVPEWYGAPTFYFTNPHTVRATEDTIHPPAGCAELDFETEVAAVVGTVPGSSGSDLDAETAQKHIFGYTILNDWSARDLQRREMKVSLGPCKGKDFANTLGPWLVTADEFEESHDAEGFLPIAMRVQVNGALMGEDLLSNMG